MAAARVGGRLLGQSRRHCGARATRGNLCPGLPRGAIAHVLRDMGEWVGGGRVKYRDDVVEGLENASAAFLGLLQGKNFGKLLVKVA
jgi:NADPH-dependent curcumin reductase CurA